MNRNSILALSAAALLVIGMLAVIPLDDDPLQSLEMTLLGDRIQEVDYKETASYTVTVVNVGDASRNVQLDILGIPDFWEAVLDSDFITIPAHSSTMVTLSVTAPDPEDAASPDFRDIAEIGVRGGNVTIGTITVLRGSASVYRDGSDISLKSGDEIISGDIVTTVGNSSIALSVSRLFYDEEGNETNVTGDIAVILKNAEVGFLKSGSEAYMTVYSGDVIVKVTGGGGGGRGEGRGKGSGEGRGARAESPLLLTLSDVDVVDEAFPGKPYNALLQFNSLPRDIFLAVDVTPESTDVELYEGTLDVKNDYETITLDEFERTELSEYTPIPEPTPVKKTIIYLDSDGSVEASVYSGGVNVLEMYDVRHISAGERTFFIVPNLPEITVNVNGRADGEYSVGFLKLDDFSASGFTLASTGSVGTTDSLAFTGDTLELTNMEKDKTYDLSISYNDKKTGKLSSFKVEDIKTSNDKQAITVQNWEELDSEEEAPVKIKQGDKTVDMKNGDTGEDVEEVLQEEEDKDNWVWMSFVLIVIFVVILSILMALYGNKDW